jgi:ribosomal-protein-alanine N-acetyltransferase
VSYPEAPEGNPCDVRDDLLVIVTPRLVLHPLPPRLLAALAGQDWAAADRLAPFPVDAQTFAGDEWVLGLRLAQVQADAVQAPWLLRAAVSRDTGRVVGKGGFHAGPDADGTVEIGYRVSEDQRRQGLAREIAIGLLGWAADSGAARCLASIRPDNTPSLRLTERLGFVRTGEQVDEIDGLEWIFTRELDEPLPPYEARR